MQKGGKVTFGGGNVSGFTPGTILEGIGYNITEIDYNNITINKLVFKEPITFTTCNIEGETNTSNEISINRDLIYYKNEINSIFQEKISGGLGIIINDNSNISVNFSDGGWTSNIDNNNLYPSLTSTNIGIGLTNPTSKLHIYDNINPILTIQNSRNLFNLSFTPDNYFSLNNKIKINNNNSDYNTLLVLDNNKISINNNLEIGNNLNFKNIFNYSQERILINNNPYSTWLLNYRNFATSNYVETYQTLTDNTILYGIGSYINNIDYNKITLNKLSFQTPLALNLNNNTVSIDSNAFGWNINNSTKNIYINNSYNNYNLGIGNTNPLSYLHIGNYNLANTNLRTSNDPSLIISKIDNNINRNFKIGFDENLNFSIGNYNIDTNNNLNNRWNKQFIINKNSSPNSIIIDDLTLNNTTINTKLTLNSQLIINNNSIFFNNNNYNFNINFNNNNFNINNFLILNNLGNIGIGTSPINSTKLIINGNLNVLSNLNSLSFSSLNGTVNNLLINFNLTSANINSTTITNSSTITTNNITINNLANTNFINNNNLITSKNLNILSTINTINLISENITNSVNITSSTINTNLLIVTTSINTANINISDTLNTFRIITNNINNTSLITTNNLTVNNSLNTFNINNTGLITTNNINNASLITTNLINANTLNSTSINNSSTIKTNTINSTIINSDNIITNSANINSSLNANSITSINIVINNNISTPFITVNDTATTNNLICNGIIKINVSTTNSRSLRSYLQIYDPNNTNNATFVISGPINNFRFGYDANNNFILGSFNNSIWKKQLIIYNNAPDNSITINDSGNVTIGIDNTINYNINNYKLNINGSLNASEIFKSGETIVTSSTLTNTITNSLTNYTNTTDLNNNFINKVYLNYVVDNNNNTVQNYINNFLTITENVYSPILRFPENTYDKTSYTNNLNLNYYLNSNIYAYVDNITVYNTDVNSVRSSNSYNIYSSSRISGYTDFIKARLFNYDDNTIVLGNLWNYKNYDQTGTFITNSTETINIINSNSIFNYINYYNGDYIIIKLPKELVLNKFRFYSLSTSLIYAPGNWKCIYSNSFISGSSWGELVDASISLSNLRLNTTDYKTDIYNNYYYEKKLTNNGITCDHLGFVFNKLALQKNQNYLDVNSIRLELSRIELFFNQIVKPIYISSNVLNNYLLDYSPVSLLSTKQDTIYPGNGLSFLANGTLAIDPTYFLTSGTPNDNLSNLSNVIVNYINSLNNIWASSIVNRARTNNIYYSNINGCVGIGTDNPNPFSYVDYKLDVNGTINTKNINIINRIDTKDIYANKFYGDGSSITNLNYNNLSTKPDLTGINNIIYNSINKFYYTSNFNANLSVGYDIFDNNYKLNINGSIYSTSNINAKFNIQENNINLRDKYLAIDTAASIYLRKDSGYVNNLVIGINNYIDTNYKLIVNGNINCFSNINANNFIENGSFLKDIYIKKFDADRAYFSIINGGTIFDNVIMNKNLNIGTDNNQNYLYKLNVNGNINSFANIYAINFIENGKFLSNIYLSKIDASTTYFKNIGGTIDGNININGSINASNIYSNNNLIDFTSYVTNVRFNNTINLYTTKDYLINNYITSNRLIDYYFPQYSKTGEDINYLKIDSSGAVLGDLFINGIVNSSSNINVGFSSTSIPLNPNNYLININGAINASNIYSNNNLIDFNSYLRKDDYSNSIRSYTTLNYLSNNYITSNDLTSNYFSQYSTTGNDSNYLKINSSGSIGNLTINGLLNINSNINVGFSSTSIPLNPNNYLININGAINASNIYSNNNLIDFNSYLRKDNYSNSIRSYATLNYLSNNYITSNDLTSNYFSQYSKTGEDTNYLKINSSGSIGNLTINGLLNINSNINVGFSSTSIPLNPNNYLININGAINTSNIYSNNNLIDFNSYLRNDRFDNTINLYTTLNYLSNNYITSNDLTSNYFSQYSTTGNDSNYLKINSSGSVLNISNLIISNITSSNINSSKLFSSNISSSNINSSNLISSNINCLFNISSSNFIENGINLKNKYLNIFDASNTYFNYNSNNFVLGSNIINYNLNINGNINCYSNIIENGSNLKDKYLMINNLTSSINNNLSNFLNIQKKYGFRVMCSVPIIINNSTFYKYDINISRYIKNRSDSLNSNPYRIFNIKCFTFDTLFDTGIANKAPNILQYDIYMSSIDANVNVIAIGFPSNYYLTKITAGDIFILKTSSYNYISILSRNINTKITCIISDILF